MNKAQMVRILKFHELVCNRRYPNRKSFALRYGSICERTISRDIEYIKYQLNAPLEYDYLKNGYFYTEPWRLPSFILYEGSKGECIPLLIEQIKKLSPSERDFIFKSVASDDSNPPPPAPPRKLYPYFFRIAG